MKFIAYKDFGKLIPSDEAGNEALRAIKQGVFVEIEVKHKRNINHHRLYWALIGKVWENIDHERYPTTDTLHGAIKISVGLRTEIHLPGDRLAYMPGSIAFHKMDQVEFAAFFTRVCDAVAKYFLPGVTSDELKAELYQMTGLAA